MRYRDPLRRRLPRFVDHAVALRVIAASWLPVPVLDLKRGDLIVTRLGVGRVRGWTWRLTRAQVCVEVTLITGDRHTETFSDDEFAMRRSHR
jgi:hypothetical protein